MTTPLSTVTAAALAKFGPPFHGQMSKADYRRAERKRQEIRDVAKAFHDTITANPDASREEAIRSTVAMLATLLSFLFPQYALAIRIAGYLWDLLHGGA